ncbi:MAG: tetratricopeptide repeat protein [Quinella sp. 3Q1]|nr:tetratricopeptide repeat protein [Quinella sp. 3Q1]
MQKFVRRALTAFLIVIFALSAAIVGAAVKIFDGYGECEMGEFTTMPKVKERALERAKLDAQKQAGIYWKAESRSIASELVDDAISAVTNNIIEISDVKYETITQKITERTTAVVVVAKLKASIDPEGFYEFIKRDEKEKVTIIQQNDSLQDAIAKNDKEFEDLKEQYKRATSQADKDRIIKQMEQVNRDFLANQKNEEGLKLNYAKDYHGAIKLYNEAIEFKPDYAEAYYNRGNTYKNLRKYEQAIQDYNKAIELKPNYAEAYNNRGTSYRSLKQDEQAIQDFNKALKFKQHEFIYANRGMVYEKLEQYERAIKDYDKAIKLNPNFTEMYNERGNIYMKLKLYKRAIQDYTKVISLNSNLSEGDLKLVYYNRGFCYQYIGDNEKAQADFAKAKELGYNG